MIDTKTHSGLSKLGLGFFLSASLQAGWVEATKAEGTRVVKT